MELAVFNKYLIKSDNIQYVLYRKRKNNKDNIRDGLKKKQFFPPTYHSTFLGVLRKIKEYEILNSRVKTIEELAQEIKKIDLRIKEIQEKIE